jgi:hypothetical protein
MRHHHALTYKEPLSADGISGAAYSAKPPPLVHPRSQTALSVLDSRTGP